MSIAEIVSIICLPLALLVNILVIHFYRSKPLGMQTLMDLLYIDFVLYHGGLQFCACVYTFLPRPMEVFPALILTRIPHIFILAMTIQLSVISVGKFVHVYQQHLIVEADLTDKEINNRIRGLNFFIIAVTETVAVCNGHAYREFEYLVGECYQGNCDKGQVAGFFMLIAVALKGILSSLIFVKERNFRRRIGDVHQTETSSEDARKRAKVVKTFAAIMIILVYGLCMTLLMTQGEGLMDDRDAVRIIGLVSICVAFPVAVLLMKENYRKHLVKIGRV